MAHPFSRSGSSNPGQCSCVRRLLPQSGGAAPSRHQPGAPKQLQADVAAVNAMSRTGHFAKESACTRLASAETWGIVLIRVRITRA